METAKKNVACIKLIIACSGLNIAYNVDTRVKHSSHSETTSCYVFDNGEQRRMHEGRVYVRRKHGLTVG